MCAWSRTIEYQGEWISFEEYLKRHFGIDTSHSISPDVAQKLLQNSKSMEGEPKLLGAGDAGLRQFVGPESGADAPYPERSVKGE